MDNDILGQLKEQDETAYFLNIIRDQDIPAMVSDLAILDEEGKKSLHALIERAEKNRLLLHKVKLDDLSALFLAFQRITLMTYRHALHNTWLRMAKEHLADIEKIFAHGDQEKEAYEKEATQLKEKIKNVETLIDSQQRTIEIMVNSMAPNIEKTAQDMAEMKPHVKGVPAVVARDKDENVRMLHIADAKLEYMKELDETDRKIDIGCLEGKPQTRLAKELNISRQTVIRRSNVISDIREKFNLPRLVWNSHLKDYTYQDFIRDSKAKTLKRKK